MKRKSFVIPSLMIAGILPVGVAKSTVPQGGHSGGNDDDDELIRQFALDHQFLLAQHRSHSSHSSHSSHRSGTSGSPRAPVYVPPAPRPPKATPTPSPSPSPSRNNRSTPPSSILPSSPATAGQSLYGSPTASQVQDVVRKVQIGLMAYGYYQGKLDGIVGPGTRTALRRFQTDFKLNVTGTVTPQVLDALKISAQ